MFNRVFFFFLAVFSGASFFQSCEQEESMMSDQLQLRFPYGEWKFEGFATHANEAAYKNNKGDYSVSKLDVASPLLLHLKKDGMFSGNTPVNTIHGDYTFHGSRGTFAFTTIESTDMKELPDGTRYIACFKVVNSYAVFEKTLHLYYEDKSRFLLFTAVEKEAAR